MLVHILIWRYSDNSSFGVVGAFLNHEQAEYQLTLLKEHGDFSKQFDIVPMEVK